MRRKPVSLIVPLLLVAAAACVHASYVKIECLTKPSTHLTPPNPVTVSGKVISVDPFTISDGSGEIMVTGVTAALNDTVVVTGDLGGSILHCDGSFSVYGDAA